jgi:hypothetical protein
MILSRGDAWACCAQLLTARVRPVAPPPLIRAEWVRRTDAGSRWSDPRPFILALCRRGSCPTIVFVVARACSSLVRISAWCAHTRQEAAYAHSRDAGAIPARRHRATGRRRGKRVIISPTTVAPVPCFDQGRIVGGTAIAARGVLSQGDGHNPQRHPA